MMNYHIDYRWDEEYSEVRYTITDDSGAHVYDEIVIDEFDSIADVEMTGYEIAKSRGYWPATYERTPEKEFFAAIGKKGGKKTAKKGKKHFSEIGKKGAEKRWKKQD